MSETTPTRPAAVPSEILAEIDQAIGDHLVWLLEWHRAFVCGDMPSARDVARDPHHLCRFGSWYVKNQHHGLVDQPAVHGLAKTHRDMHDRAKNLMDRAGAGHAVAEEDHAALEESVALFIDQARRLEKAFATAASELDPLTGVRNRQSMGNDLERERARVLRSGHPCFVAIGDIDHFKKVNDTHGHAVGDQVLAACAHRFLDHLRPYDMVYRYGGEEFLFCLPDSDIEQAVGVLERMRRVLSETPVEAADGQRIAITASFGVASMDEDADADEAARRADAALYEAKRTGRDRVARGAGILRKKGKMIHETVPLRFRPGSRRVLRRHHRGRPGAHRRGVDAFALYRLRARRPRPYRGHPCARGSRRLQPLGGRKRGQRRRVAGPGCTRHHRRRRRRPGRRGGIRDQLHAAGQGVRAP